MQKMPKGLTTIVTTLILAIALNEKAYSQSIGDEAGNTFGVAEMFTPQQNFSFSSLTLYVTGYYDTLHPNNSSSLNLELSYDQNYEDPSYPFHEPDQFSFAGASSTISYSTGPYYDFNLSASLQAGVPYWIFLYLGSPDATGPGVGCSWGGIPDIVGIQASSPQIILIDGGEPFADGFIPNDFSQIGQDFTLNVVPEPGTNTIFLIGSLILGSYLLNFRVLKRALRIS